MSKSVRFFRISYIALAWIFVACVLLQVFIAGAAVFDPPHHWEQHKTFVHFFEFLPILMLIIAFPAKLSKSIRWQSLGLYGVIFVQYATANLSSVWVIAALHPVIAVALFWWSVSLARRAQREKVNM